MTSYGCRLDLDVDEAILLRDALQILAAERERLIRVTPYQSALEPRWRNEIERAGEIIKTLQECFSGTNVMGDSDSYEYWNGWEDVGKAKE